MQFTTLLFAAVAFIGSATAAQTDPAPAVLNITNIDVSGLKEGVPFKVTWGSAKGPVTLTLQTGLDANNLSPYQVLTSAGSYPDGSYTFTPGPQLPSGDYNFLVSDGSSKDNYSKQFQYFAVSSSTSSTVSATSTATTSAAQTSSTAVVSNSTTSAISSDPVTSTSAISTKASSTAPATTSVASVNAPGSASGLASPIAMVLLGLAAFMGLN